MEMKGTTSTLNLYRLANQWRIPDCFNTEWLTVGRHRIYLTVRCGFPEDYHRRIATLAAEACSSYSDSARVVELNHDDKHGCLCVDIASDDPTDASGELEATLSEIWLEVGHWIDWSIDIYPAGSKNSDAYNHAWYLADCHFRRRDTVNLSALIVGSQNGRP
jgi:hypothetical protein